jgi:hypothetical protein
LMPWPFGAARAFKIGLALAPYRLYRTTIVEI